jgi:hypothetical protein
MSSQPTVYNHLEIKEKWHNPALVFLQQDFLQMNHRMLQHVLSFLSSLLLVITLLLDLLVLVHWDALRGALMSVKKANYMTVHLLPPAGSPGF